MNISPQQVLAVISVASSVTTAIFLGAYFLGRLRGQLERAEERIAEHSLMLRSQGERLEAAEGEIRALGRVRVP